MKCDLGNITILTLEKENLRPFLKLFNGTILGFGGIEYQILKILSRSLGFEYNVVLPIQETDESYDRMLSMLSNQSVYGDIAINSLSVTSDRMNYVDFSTPYIFTDVTFVTRGNNYQNSANLGFFYKQFSVEVWITIFAITTAWFCLVKLYDTLIGGINPFNIVLLWGNAYKVVKSHGRTQMLIYATSTICHCVLLTFYRIVLTTSASHSDTTTTMDTVSQLIIATIYDEYRTGSIDGFGYNQLIASSSNTQMMLLSRSLVHNSEEMVKSFKEGFDKVLNEKFALILGRDDIHNQIFYNYENVTELFHVANEGFYTDYFAIAYSKYFPCQEAFDNSILRIFAAGLIFKWNMKLQFNEEKVWHKMRISGLIGIKDMRLAMAAYATALIIATFIILVEYVVHFQSNSWNNHRQDYLNQLLWADVLPDTIKLENRKVHKKFSSIKTMVGLREDLKLNTYFATYKSYRQQPQNKNSKINKK